MLDEKTKELTELIYDTLLKNTNYEQFDINNVEDQEIDTENGQIKLKIKGETYDIFIRKANFNI